MSNHPDDILFGELITRVHPKGHVLCAILPCDPEHDVMEHPTGMSIRDFIVFAVIRGEAAKALKRKGRTDG